MEIIKQLSGISLSLAFSIAWVPQIYRIYRNKSSKDVSLWMLLLSAVGYSSGLTYVITNDIARLWVVVNYTSGLFMTGITVLAWWKYRVHEIESGPGRACTRDIKIKWTRDLAQDIMCMHDDFDETELDTVSIHCNPVQEKNTCATVEYGVNPSEYPNWYNNSCTDRCSHL
jgi:uncharacterized protein with PQ loop repeat